MYKILIVEDQELLLKTIIHRLAKEQYEVAFATDGLSAKEKFLAFKPDLVITDLLLPFATGFELIQFIRYDQNSHVPIIVLTAMDTDEPLQEAFNLGADDYVIKPFRPIELLARIQRFLKKNTGFTQMSA